ncbi:NADPH-dependent FMN reductase [Bradyrhizobium sp. HKCCYLS2038]|uniref:NADPH-dependent FMN reductase n=1 Tax=unclassified Bradyrhizobium TaxID=2631580 RepID=UPI003EB78C70
MSVLKILIIPGSTRAGSHNVKLAAAAAYQFVQAGADITRISLADFPLPIYDADLEARSGVPRDAVNLKRMMAAHHGVLLVTPEYNAAVPPLLGNALAWLSRVDEPPEGRGHVFRSRPFAIASASENRFGGVRALAALRLMLTACNATVIPSQLALAFADKAYNDMDRLRLPADAAALDALVRQLIDFAQHTV